MLTTTRKWRQKVNSTKFHDISAVFAHFQISLILFTFSGFQVNIRHEIICLWKTIWRQTNRQTDKGTSMQVRRQLFFQDYPDRKNVSSTKTRDRQHWKRVFSGKQTFSCPQLQRTFMKGVKAVKGNFCHSFLCTTAAKKVCTQKQTLKVNDKPKFTF